jgi:hypothetical protein
MAAAVELETARRLATALEAENSELNERLATEKRVATLLTELTASRSAETDALRSAIDAKNETIKAKDAVITSQEKLTTELEAKRPSPWRRIGDVLIGVAAAALLK